MATNTEYARAFQARVRAIWNATHPVEEHIYFGEIPNVPDPAAILNLVSTTKDS